MDMTTTMNQESYKDEGEIYRSGKSDIIFSAPINDKTAFRLIRLIREITEEIKEAVESAKKSTGSIKNSLVDIVITPQPITLYLTTCGGSVHSAWAIVDTILKSDIEFHTVISGFVASAGTLISVAGKKRFMYPHAHALIHEVRSGAWGRYSDMRDQFANTDKIMNTLVSFYTERTNLGEEELRTLLSRDRYWDCHESLQHGLIDEIL